MKQHAHWYLVRTAKDAPEELRGSERTSWAWGYNDAVKACVKEQNQALESEAQT